MAGDWIQFEIATLDKPEVHRMAASLSVPVGVVGWACLRLWSYAQTHTTTGKIVGGSKALVDSIGQLPGFADAMIAEKWLIDKGTYLLIPRWDRLNGKGAKTRALSAKRASRFRNADTVTKSAPKAEQKQSRATATAEAEKSNTKPALQKHGAGFDARDSSALCSLLLAVRTSGGGPVFDRKTAAAIVQRTDGDRARILWAVKRYDEDTKAGKAITNPGGWIRAIAEREDPPDGFRLELRRKEIEGLAMKDKRLEEAAAGGAKCG